MNNMHVLQKKKNLTQQESVKRNHTKWRTKRKCNEKQNKTEHSKPVRVSDET